MELFTDVNYSSVLSHQYGGSGKYSDRYIYNSAQEGDGFGSVFSSLGAVAMPILKKMIPFLKGIGKEAIKGGVDYALGKSVQSNKRKVRHRSDKRKFKRKRHV